jgi:hypothetical protein
MTIENSTLNDSAALPNSNASLTGGSGDGNSLSLADLAKGYSSLPAPERIPHWLPQNADDGENYVGDPFGERGGAAGRPHGNER